MLACTVVHWSAPLVLVWVGLYGGICVTTMQRREGVSGLKSIASRLLLLELVCVIPAVIVLPWSGNCLLDYYQIPWTSFWIQTSLILFSVSGGIWLIRLLVTWQWYRGQWLNAQWSRIWFYSDFFLLASLAIIAGLMYAGSRGLMG